MKKTRVNKTAQVNLMMLADLGIEEAVHFHSDTMMQRVLLQQ